MNEKKRKAKCLYTVCLLTISDRCWRGEQEDKSGKALRRILAEYNFDILSHDVVPDEIALIKEKLLNYCDQLEVDLVLTTGGTGLGPRDFTPEATQAVIERQAPGITEAMRFYGLKYTKKAMLSRGIAGIRGKTLIINLPGSLSGAEQSLKAIIDELPHGLDMLLGKEH